MVSIIVEIYPEAIAKLENIGHSGLASDGHRLSFEYCLIKAIEEFIKKYEEI